MTRDVGNIITRINYRLTQRKAGLFLSYIELQLNPGPFAIARYSRRSAANALHHTNFQFFAFEGIADKS